MVMKNDDFRQYISKPSEDIDIMKSAVIKAYCFTDSVEAVGISYQDHRRTIKEMEKEKQYIIKNYQDLDIEIKKGVTARQRLKKLDEDIAKRREKYSSRKKATRKSNNKSDNLLSMKRSQKKLVRLLKANFSRPVFALCATLTYREKQYSAKNVYKDFSQCSKKLRYRFPNMRYIAIYEPHEDGGWHIHVVYSGAKGLTKDIFENLWNWGHVHIEKFDALAAPYFCKIDERIKFYSSRC